MARPIRSVAAVVGGALLAMAIVSAGDAAAGRFWPLPSGTDMHDTAQVRHAMESLPVATFILFLVAWTLAIAAGAYVATRFSAVRRVRHGLILTGLFLFATIINLSALPHPVWLWIAAIISIPIAGWSATNLAARSPRPTEVAV